MKKSFRPTKAASKRRRDLLNSEVSQIRNLLPFSEIQRQRLSQIQVMSLCNAYVALNGFLADFCLKDDDFGQTAGSLNLTQIFPGFLLILSSSGQVLYVSDSVVEYLGYSSMELFTQGDSVYDFIEAEDHSSLRLILESMSMPDAFSSRSPQTAYCRMFLAQNFRNLYGYSHFRTMNIKGRVVWRPQRDSRCGATPESIFVAMVVPHSKPFFDSIDFPAFQSVHGLDMKFSEIEHHGCIWLGYNADEMRLKSWYEMIIPDDVPRAKEMHLNILRSQVQDHRPSSFCVRIQTRSGNFIRLNTTMHLRRCADKLEIVCSNYIVTDENARQILRDGDLNHADIARSDGAQCERMVYLNSSMGSVSNLESSSGSFSRARRAVTETRLRSPYPLIKAMLSRPTVRDLRSSTGMPTCSFDVPSTVPQQVGIPVVNAFPGSQPGAPVIEELLTPQNSPPDRCLQDFSHTDTLSPKIYASDGLSGGWDMKPVARSCWEQNAVGYNYCETPPMDQSDLAVVPNLGLTEAPSTGFEQDVETMPLDVIVDALKAMQSDPEFSKDVESLDLGVFSKSFPGLDRKNPSASKLQSDSSANPLVNMLLPYFNSTATKLSSDQVDALNQRLFELKKIHETLVFEAVVETLHCGNAKSANCWSGIQESELPKETMNL